jgi:hypothetical protein
MVLFDGGPGIVVRVHKRGEKNDPADGDDERFTWRAFKPAIAKTAQNLTFYLNDICNGITTGIGSISVKTSMMMFSTESAMYFVNVSTHLAVDISRKP